MSNFTFRHASNGAEIADGIDTILVETNPDGSKKVSVHTDGTDFSEIVAVPVDPPTDGGDDADRGTDQDTSGGDAGSDTGQDTGGGDTGSDQGSSSGGDDTTPPNDGTPAKPKTADINNQSELDAAIQNPGDYTVAPMFETDGSEKKYSLSNAMSSGVRLIAHGKNAQPVFGSHRLDDKQNLTFDGLIFRYDPQPGHQTSHPHLNHYNCTNIDYINALVVGGLWNDVGDPSQTQYNWGEGIQMWGCNGFYIGQSKFRGFSKAIQPNRAANLEIIRNDIGFFGSDGISHSDIWDSLIEENYIHHCVDQKPGAHGDKMQGFGEQQRVKYLRNFCDKAGGLYTQGWHNKTQTVKRAVEAIDNIFILAHTNGHTGGNWEQSVIRGEIMVRAKNDFAEAHEPNGLGGDSLRGLWQPKIRVDGDILIENCRAPEIYYNGVSIHGTNGNVRDEGDESAVRAMARARLPFFDYSGA